MSDTTELDNLVRDACSVGHYGPKSLYRKRLIAWASREAAKELRKVEDQVFKLHGHWELGDYLRPRIAELTKEAK